MHRNDSKPIEYNRMDSSLEREAIIDNKSFHIRHLWCVTLYVERTEYIRSDLRALHLAM